MSELTSGERIAALAQVVEKDPATALYLSLAEWLREQGRVEEAIRLCEERKNRPGHGVGDHVVLGRCYLADGRLGDARSEFEAALQLDRENVAALKALAGILAHEGEHARAVDLYRAVCRVDPGDLESQTALHQITSGEFADVCPADVVVGQGGLGWDPVCLPKEEDHLVDLALGLRTITSFDATTAPDPEAARARSFQEFSTEELDREAAARNGSAAPPGDEAMTRFIELDDPGAEADVRPAAPTLSPEREAEPAEEAPEGSSGLGRPKKPADARQPGVSGNRSAFEDWVRRLGGGA